MSYKMKVSDEYQLLQAMITSHHVMQLIKDAKCDFTKMTHKIRKNQSFNKKKFFFIFIQ